MLLIPQFLPTEVGADFQNYNLSFSPRARYFRIEESVFGFLYRFVKE